MFIANKLKEYREEKKLTQTDLMFELDKIGLRMSRQTLINWESGTTIPNANEIDMIASFFKKPIQSFFD